MTDPFSTIAALGAVPVVVIAEAREAIARAAVERAAEVRVAAR